MSDDRSTDDPTPRMMADDDTDADHDPPAIVERVRARVLAYAATFDGTDVDSSPDLMEVIAPVDLESLAVRDGMRRGWTCATFARGVLRAALADCGARIPARLAAPYLIGHAVTDLWTIAAQANALRHGEHRDRPRPGDMLCMTAPEHVAIVTQATRLPDDRMELRTVEGGHIAPNGAQCVRPRRYLSPHLGGAWTIGAKRVAWWLDLSTVAAIYGARDDQ